MSSLTMASVLLQLSAVALSQCMANVTVHSNLTGLEAVGAVRAHIGNRTLWSFVGYWSNISSDSATREEKFVRKVLADASPERVVVSADGVQGGLDAVYNVARELNFSTIGIIASSRVESFNGTPPYVADEIFVVNDEQWGGFENTSATMHHDISYEISPTSDAIVSLSSLVVGLGGPEGATQEMRAAIDRSTPVRAFDVNTDDSSSSWSYFNSHGYICDDTTGVLRDRCFVCDGDGSLCSGTFDRSKGFIAYRAVDWWSPRVPQNITSVKVAVLSLENTLIVSDPHSALGSSYTWLPGVVDRLRKLAQDHVLLVIDNFFMASCQQYTTTQATTTQAAPASATSTTVAPASLSRKRGEKSHCTPYSNKFDFNETYVASVEFKLDDMADTLGVPLAAAIWLSNDAETMAKPAQHAFVSAVETLVLFRHLNMSDIDSVLVIGSEAGRADDKSCIDRQFADAINTTVPVTFMTPQQWLLGTAEEKYDCSSTPPPVTTTTTTTNAGHSTVATTSAPPSVSVEMPAGESSEVDVANKILFFFVGFGAGTVVIGLICWLVQRRQKRTSGYERLLTAE